MRTFAVLIPCLLVAACSTDPVPNDVTEQPINRDAGSDALPVVDAFAVDAFAADAPAVDAFTADAPVTDAPVTDAPVDGGMAVALSCMNSSECASGNQCTGLGEGGVGRCRDLTPIPGEGNACSGDSGCAANLICTLTRAGGSCVPGWMLGTFTGTGLTIPDNNTTGATISVNAAGVGTVSTEIVLRFRLEHSRSSDVRVYLTNPSGTEELAWDGSGEPALPVLDVERFVPTSGDESANGLWHLRAVDLRSGDTGRLTSWSLTLRSRFD